METKIVSLPAWRMAGLKHVGDYWGLADAWPRFHALAQQQDLFHPDGPVMCTFLDSWDIPEAERRSYPSLVLKPGCDRVESPLEILEVPGGRYACTPHFGSYETIGETWMRWREEWLPASGWVLDTTRPCFEWYQNHPRVTPPELLLTLLCDAVKPA